jgi:hypothetical protein
LPNSNSIGLNLRENCHGRQLDHRAEEAGGAALNVGAAVLPMIPIAIAFEVNGTVYP